MYSVCDLGVCGKECKVATSKQQVMELIERMPAESMDSVFNMLKCMEPLLAGCGENDAVASTKENTKQNKVSKFDIAVGLFWGMSFILGLGVFFVGGFSLMESMHKLGWAISFFAGMTSFLVIGLLLQAIMTLKKH